MIEPAPLTVGMYMFGEECITTYERAPGGSGGRSVDVQREVLF